MLCSTTRILTERVCHVCVWPVTHAIDRRGREEQ